MPHLHVRAKVCGLYAVGVIHSWVLYKLQLLTLISCAWYISIL